MPDTRKVEDVIDQILTVIPATHDFLIQRLVRVKSDSHYVPPENKRIVWRRLMSVLESELPIPPRTAWQERVRAIVRNEQVTAPQPKHPIAWPDPTEEDQRDPIFNAIWEVIKTWDIAAPLAYTGPCGATGNHAKAILDAIRNLSE